MHEVVKIAFNYNISCINKKATGEKKKKKGYKKNKFPPSITREKVY